MMYAANWSWCLLGMLVFAYLSCSNNHMQGLTLLVCIAQMSSSDAVNRAWYTNDASSNALDSEPLQDFVSLCAGISQAAAQGCKQQAAGWR